jgi:hypothetical protein
MIQCHSRESGNFQMKKMQYYILDLLMILKEEFICYLGINKVNRYC